MFEVARQLHFTRSLEHLSARLDELINSVRLHQMPLPPELIDEIALIADELMLVLTNHQSSEEETALREVLSHAKSLRQRLRADQPHCAQLAEECDSFSREVARLVSDTKKAA